MKLKSELTIAEIKKMELNDQIEALSSIWDHIAELNPLLQLSKEEKKLLDARFADESQSEGLDWKSLKNEILNRAS